MAEIYLFDDTKIVYEILQNELVLVNLENGYYYILDHTASVIWQIIRDGSTIDEAVGSLMRMYQGAENKIRQDVETLVKELVQESILTAALADPAEKKLQLKNSLQGEKKAFPTPTMFKYTDMEYLIQMDPIWNYDETGWPIRRPDSPNEKK